MSIFQKHPHNFKFLTNRLPYRSRLLPSSSARRRRASLGPVVSLGPVPPNCLLRRRTGRAPPRPRTRAPSSHRTCSSAAKDLRRPACSVAAQDVLLRRQGPTPPCLLRRRTGRAPPPPRTCADDIPFFLAGPAPPPPLRTRARLDHELPLRLDHELPQALSQSWTSNWTPSAASLQLAAPPLLVLPHGAPLLVCCRLRSPARAAAGEKKYRAL